MIVPKQYVQAAPRRARSTDFSEKNSSTCRSTRSPSNSPSLRARSPLSSSLFRSRDSSPTRSQSRTDSRPSSVRLLPQKPEDCQVSQRPQPVPVQKEESPAPRFRRESVKDVLSATAIPIRRKPKGRVSQRLPRGDHVPNFSTLLMDDLKSSSSAMHRSNSNSNIDALFGNMDELLEEGQMYVGSEGLDSGLMSQPSLSDASLVSLSAPDDFIVSDRNSQHSSASVPERKMRHVAASEDCSNDHPLSLPEGPAESDHTPELSPSPPTIRKLSGKSDKRPRQSLKSSLTASLKALKSAAQSVSNRTSSESADKRARDFFDFNPALTDDRRPPPSLEEPTADLRRYLSPPPLDSAAQLHFWQDHRHSKFDAKPQKDPRKQKRKATRSPARRGRTPPGSNPLVDDLPSIVQLANCLPPSVRTENASSPPIWLTSEGVPVNKNTSVPLLFDPNANDGRGEPVGFRHREPRENRDFLRVFVCEMQMRRGGKLSEDLSAGRARLWLPPVGSEDRTAASKKEGNAESSTRKKKTARERMACQSIEDV